MKLTNMKLTTAEQKAMMSPSLAVGDRPRYPWGLSITLDTDTLDKLGLKKLPEVGAEFYLCASADVVSLSSNESEGGKNRSLSLQITALSLELEDDTDAAGAADKLYGEKGDA